mmetsp:Transcript_11299/g.34581  ORF Transcript_11299/g.34581 Transcript_11299/m.34581 type:complete len:130 (+) Transcript_11299:128-517(+)
MSHQDWAPMTLSNKPRDNKAKVKQAERSGGVIATEKKFGAGGNKKQGDKNMAKLDAETEDFHVERVSFSVAKEIQKARLAKKMTQAQLAQQVNEKVQVINEYESGKAVPNNQILGKMERVLGVKLRGRK